ncbi:MAG TPA: hypothetical protein VGG50_11605 [Streptosporangiaceae bacterium]|jgi:hypothetical protein
MGVIVSPYASAAVGLVEPSGDTSGAKDAVSIAAAVAAGQQLAPGTFYLVPGALVIAQPSVPQYLRGSGIGSTIIKAVAGTTGDVVRMYNPTPNTGGGSGGVFGGGVLGVTIDGTSAAAGSRGLHIGDMEGAELDVCTQNFAGTGSIGCYIDNTIWWTEKLSGKIFIWNNTSHVVWDVTGTGAGVSASHGYQDLIIQIEAETGQNGLVVQGGAKFYNGNLKVRGDFNTGSTSNSALTVTGQAAHGVDAGSYSVIWQSRLDIQVESDGASDFPQTINIGTASLNADNAIIECSGIMAFTGTWTSANVYGNSVDSTGVVNFDGYIIGDANLSPTNLARTSAGPVIYSTAFGDNSGPIQTQSGDFFALTLASNLTVNLKGYFTTTQPGPQRKTLIITQAASGGPYTVTWPHTGSPTASAPTVKWAAGVAPTMSVGASAADMYELSTLDGITWVGRATQNVS